MIERIAIPSLWDADDKNEEALIESATANYTKLDIALNAGFVIQSEQLLPITYDKVVYLHIISVMIT